MDPLVLVRVPEGKGKAVLAQEGQVDRAGVRCWAEWAGGIWGREGWSRKSRGGQEWGAGGGRVGMRVGSELANRKKEVFGWGSWTVWSKKRGERGGGGSGAGRGWVLLEWSRKGGSREGGREWGRGGWVEWEGGQARRFWWVNCPKQKRGSFWLGFLDRVEQEGTGAGGGREWGWGGVGWSGRGVPSTDLLVGLGGNARRV